jgi:hypothetical protein
MFGCHMPDSAKKFHVLHLFKSNADLLITMTFNKECVILAINDNLFKYHMDNDNLPLLFYHNSATWKKLYLWIAKHEYLIMPLKVLLEGIIQKIRCQIVT